MARVTIKDIAREAGVSTSTVSYALNKQGVIKTESHKRIWAVAHRLGYSPDIAARSLVKGRNTNIGVVLDPVSCREFSNPYYMHILSVLSTILTSDGGWLGICIPNDPSDDSVLDFIGSAPMDGLLWLANKISPPVGRALKNRRLPYVSIQYGESFYNEGSSILVNDCLGMRSAVQYLLALGHRRILYIAGCPPETGDGRTEAFLKGTSLGHGCRVHILNGMYDDMGAHDAVKTHLAEAGPWFTAVLASSDLMAFGVVRALASVGLRVPFDVSVVGFDGIPGSGRFSPPLTTMAQPIEVMMGIAYKHLKERIDGSVTTIMREEVVPDLVIRESTCRPCTMDGD